MTDNEKLSWFAFYVFPAVLFALATLDFFIEDPDLGRGQFFAASGFWVTISLSVFLTYRLAYLAGRKR